MIKIILFRNEADGTHSKADMIDEHLILKPVAEFLSLHFSDQYSFEIKTTVQRISKKRKLEGTNYG